RVVVSARPKVSGVRSLMREVPVRGANIFRIYSPPSAERAPPSAERAPPSAERGAGRRPARLVDAVLTRGAAARGLLTPEVAVVGGRRRARRRAADGAKPLRLYSNRRWQEGGLRRPRDGRRRDLRSPRRRA